MLRSFFFTYLEGAENTVLPTADVVLKLAERSTEGIQVPEDLKREKNKKQEQVRLGFIAARRLMVIHEPLDIV